MGTAHEGYARSIAVRADRTPITFRGREICDPFPKEEDE
jgi:hypothetical protein